MNFVSLVVLLSAICGAFAIENDDEFIFYETLPMSEYSNKFSYDLFEVIASARESDGSDIIFSPLSIYSALSLAAFGAGGRNAEQMKKALYLSEGQSIPDLYRNYAYHFNNIKNVSYNMAENFLITDKFGLYPEFKNVAEKYFRASVYRFDDDEPFDAAILANKWVDQSSNGLIPDMMASYYMGGSEGMTILSAGYFKGDWKFPFNKEFTKERDFYLYQEETKSVPMMFMKQRLMYGELPEQRAKFIRLPYQNENFEMLIILPDEVTGLENILANIRQFDEKFIKMAAREAYVQLYLPKFKVASDTFILNNYLRKLGFEDMFNSDYANFTMMSTESANLRVDDVLQKPYIEINESGTTSTTEFANFFETSSNEVMEPEIIFDVNRPFYYQIVDSGAILFQGATFFGARRTYRPKNMDFGESLLF